MTLFDRGERSSVVHVGDSLEVLRGMPDQCVHCCVTSPPYWGLRDYGQDGQIGLEKTPDEYVAKMVEVFREVRRVLRDDGTLWLNIGDSYAAGGNGGGNKNDTNKGLLTVGPKKAPPGIKPKDLVGIPWMVAFALRADGWYLRQDIIWAKPNPMPESVTDRCTKSHEYIFLMAKSQTYYYDHEAVKEPAIHKGRVVKASGKESKNANSGIGAKYKEGFTKNDTLVGELRNRRDVWTVTTKPFKGAHFATFPPDLIEPCVLAGCPEGGIVLDPFFGAGTTGIVAWRNNREYIGIELNPEYADMAKRRIEMDGDE